VSGAGAAIFVTWAGARSLARSLRLPRWSRPLRRARHAGITSIPTSHGASPAALAPTTLQPQPPLLPGAAPASAARGPASFASLSPLRELVARSLLPLARGPPDVVELARGPPDVVELPPTEPLAALLLVAPVPASRAASGGPASGTEIVPPSSTVMLTPSPASATDVPYWKAPTSSFAPTARGVLSVGATYS